MDMPRSCPWAVKLSWHTQYVDYAQYTSGSNSPERLARRRAAFKLQCIADAVATFSSFTHNAK